MDSIMTGSIYELLSSNEKSNDMYILEREIFIKDVYKYFIKLQKYKRQWVINGWLCA